jgi:hypothetical protein
VRFRCNLPTPDTEQCETVLPNVELFVAEQSNWQTASTYSYFRATLIQELGFFELLPGLNRPITASKRILKSLYWAVTPRIFVGVTTPLG